jgi:hypothetical protein
MFVTNVGSATGEATPVSLINGPGGPGDLDDFLAELDRVEAQLTRLRQQFVTDLDCASMIAAELEVFPY